MTSSEFTVEQATLVWHGTQIVPGAPWAERGDYGQDGLERRLHDTLLPRLISGELRVNDAERMLTDMPV